MDLATAPLILASASPRRRELLRQIGIPFTVEVAAVQENEAPDHDPRELVLENAALKADAISQGHPHAWVLGADTTVCVDETVLNKPADLAEAKAMLRRLSGRTHTVFTGLALRHRSQGVRLDRGVESRVVFRTLTEEVIETYLSRVHPLDKAGGYAIQEHGDLIVERYEGSLSNIIGLPLDETKQILTAGGLCF